jgi:translation initiation factor IF-2
MFVEAFDRRVRCMPAVVGVIVTQGSVRVGEETTVIRPDQVVAQLIVNLREALLAKLQGS